VERKDQIDQVGREQKKEGKGMVMNRKNNMSGVRKFFLSVKQEKKQRKNGK
jgi:hypothetical protein